MWTAKGRTRTTATTPENSARRMDTVSRASRTISGEEDPFEKMGLQSTSRETRMRPSVNSWLSGQGVRDGTVACHGVLIGWELLQRKAHIFIRFMADHYRPDSRPNHVYVINYKTSTGSWTVVR